MQPTTTQVLHQYLLYSEKVQHLAPKTIRDKSNYLMRFVGQLVETNIRKITITDIDHYFVQRSEQVRTVSSYNWERQTVRSYLKFAQAHMNLKLQFDYGAVSNVKIPDKDVAVFTAAQVADVICRCDDERDRLVIAILFESGLRIGELARLCVENVNGCHIRVVGGKGGKNRSTFIPQDVATQLRRYIQGHGVYTGPIFTADGLLPLHPDTLRKRIEAAFLRCGYKCTPHQLRHSFAVNWLTIGGDIRTLQKMMGHSSIETTMRYLDISDSRLAEEYVRHRTASVLQYAVQG